MFFSIDIISLRGGMCIMESEEKISFFFPSNFDEDGTILLGLINVRRLMESVVILPPLLLFLILPFLPIVKIIFAIFVALPLMAFALIGYQGMGIYTFGRNVFLFLKSSKFFSLPRVFTRTTEAIARKRNDRRRQRK